MAPTVKDSIETAGLSKAAPDSMPPAALGDSTGRANPVCLEIPVVVRSLPAEGNSSSPADPPFREECRSVIVFDNGCVLRMANPLPQGRKLILSSPRGREVVCRVSASRQLPSVKGYIEVEFLEPASNFWQLQEMGTVSGAPRPAAPPAPVLEPASASTRAVTPAPVPALVPAPVKEKTPEPSAHSAGGPTFDDISGLLPISPGKSRRPVSAPSSRTPAAPRSESVKPAPVVQSARPSWESLPEKSPAPAIKEAAEANQPYVSSLSHIGRSNSVFSGSLDSGAVSEEKRGINSWILVAAACVLAAAGTGYYFFFMRHANVGNADRPIAVVTQPMAAPAGDPAPAPAVAQASQPAGSAPAEPAPEPLQNAASAPLATTAGLTPPTELQPARSRQNELTPKKANTANSRPAALTQLKMNLPKSHGSAGMDASASGPPALDSVSAVGPAAMPNGTFAVRSESQPAPPAPAFAAASPAPAVAAAPAASSLALRAAAIVSTVRPVYPLSAKSSNIQGDVDLQVSINELGTVTAAKAVSGPILLRQAAVDSVLKWKYSPALSNGKPTASQANVTVKFRLN